MPSTYPSYRSRISSVLRPSVAPPMASPTAAAISAPIALSCNELITSPSSMCCGSAAVGRLQVRSAVDLVPAVGEPLLQRRRVDLARQELLVGRGRDLGLPLRELVGLGPRCVD